MLACLPLTSLHHCPSVVGLVLGSESSSSSGAGAWAAIFSAASTCICAASAAAWFSLSKSVWLACTGERTHAPHGLGWMADYVQVGDPWASRWSPPPPPCDIPSGCCFFTGPWTVTRSPLRMLRRVAAFCRPLRPVLLPVSFPRSRSPVVGVPGLCWMWQDVPFACQRRPRFGILGVVLVVAGVV